MNVKPRLHKLYSWISNFFIVQLFLSCISLPFLVAWGLPISPLTVVGNLVFNNVLALFLLLSSLVFFSELLHLPNGILILCLEKLSSVWIYLLRTVDETRWNYTFTLPSISLLILIPCAAFFILQHKKIVTPLQRLGALSIFFFLTVGLLYYYRPASLSHISAGKTMPLTILREHKQTVVIDNGFFAQHISSESWIEYHFITELVKKCGTKKIDHLIVYDINARTFQALAYLLNKTHIGTIYLPSFDGELNKAQKRAYARYAQQRSQAKTTITYIKKHPITINLGKKTIHINPGAPRTKDELSYPKITVEVH